MKGVADLPRWAWVAAGLLVGLACGSVREWSSLSDPLDDYGVLLTNQRQFEHALVAESHGHRHFKHVTVYPHWTRGGPGGSRQRIHLVTGLYWDGRADVKDGQVVATWQPACYVAPVPYHAASGPVPGRGGRAATVLDYLATLRETRGVEARYAWWWWARRPLWAWAFAGVLLIGGALPSALTLLAYGTLTRPPGAKRPSLWRVRVLRRRAAPVVAAVTATPGGGPGPVAAPSPAGAAGAVAQPAPAHFPRAAPPPPECEPIEAAAVEEKHYGARREDFYPTQLHTDPEPPR